MSPAGRPCSGSASRSIRDQGCPGATRDRALVRPPSSARVEASPANVKASPVNVCRSGDSLPASVRLSLTRGSLQSEHEPVQRRLPLRTIRGGGGCRSNPCRNRPGAGAEAEPIATRGCTFDRVRRAGDQDVERQTALLEEARWYNVRSVGPSRKGEMNLVDSIPPRRPKHPAEKRLLATTLGTGEPAAQAGGVEFLVEEMARSAHDDLQGAAGA